MAEKPPTQFAKRNRGAPAPPARPPQPPAKRSHHVVLLLMGTMAVGGSAYALMPRECKPAAPGAIPNLSSPSECPPRSSSSGGHGSSASRYSYSSSNTSSTTDSGTVKRGGFGSSAQAFSSHFSFGS
jgi:hypothetical protein